MKYAIGPRKELAIRTVFNIQSELSGNSYSSLVLSEFVRYCHEIFERPHQLLLGFGLGSNTYYGTSGDVGFIESVMRIGIPLWIFITWNIFKLSKSAVIVNKLEYKSTWSNFDAHLIMASAELLLSIWLMDLHYSVWIHKSVLPILFFAMALARRVNCQTTTISKRANSAKESL